MDPLILALVLLAAILHASWNALVKMGGDALVRMALVHGVSTLCAIPLLFIFPIPAAESWPYLITSVLIHQFYYAFLVLSYRVGDLSHVYPIARGIAPFLVALGAYLIADEKLSSLGIFAVGLMGAAILSLAFERGWRQAGSKPVLFSLATGVTIAAYTVCDGIGGRAAGAVGGYIGWLFFLEGIPLALLALTLRRHSLAETLTQHWRQGVLGGLFAIIAYGLVIWAMSLTPMTYVSALRETSVLIAAYIGTRLLREPFGTKRITAAGIVACGVVMLQFSRAV